MALMQKRILKSQLIQQVSDQTYLLTSSTAKNPDKAVGGVISNFVISMRIYYSMTLNIDNRAFVSIIVVIELGQFYIRLA